MTKKTVLRVGVYNNFNFTDQEMMAVRAYKDLGYLPFLNSNSFVTIRGDYPSIITINPYLSTWQPPEGDLHNVKACRVKIIADTSMYSPQIEAIEWCMREKIPVLLTVMRFKSKESMCKFVDQGSQNYKFSGNYYRLTREALDKLLNDLKRLVKGWTEDLVAICDLEGKGCPACKNCSKLTYGIDEVPESLSLSCSGNNGKCIFHCPDCWAHNLEKITSFKFDVVTRNNKQKGKVRHE